MVVLLFFLCGCMTIVNGNLAVESFDTYVSDRLIDFQDGNGQVLVGDTYPHVSSSFFGRKAGLYWMGVDVPKVENRALDRAYIIYVDPYGQALTIMKLATNMTWPGLQIKNLTRFDFYFTEEVRRKYNRFYNDFDIPLNLTADLVDGNILEVPALGLTKAGINSFLVSDSNSFVITRGSAVDIPAFIGGLFTDIKNLNIKQMSFQFFDRGKNLKLSKVQSLSGPLSIEIYPSKLPSHVDIPLADIPYYHFDDVPWYKNPSVAYIQLDHDYLYAVNRISGEQKKLVNLKTNWSRNQNDQLVVRFSYKSLLDEDEIKYLDFVPVFYADPDYYLGNLGKEQIDLSSMTNSVFSFDKAFDSESYDFSFNDICIMYADGSTIFSLQPVGDPRNTFTLLKENKAVSNSWISNPYESYLYLDDNQVVALNLRTREEVPILRLSKSWETKKQSEQTNFPFISFENLYGDLLIGGSYFGIRNSARSNYSPFVSSFRFDAQDVETYGYDYISGAIPKVVISADDLKGGVDMYYNIITISFKDGNTRQVFIPRNYVIGFN